jgi:hypothetical protein
MRTRKTFRGAGQRLAKQERRPDGFGGHFRLDTFSRQPHALRCRTGLHARKRRSRRARTRVWRVADGRFRRSVMRKSLRSYGHTSCTAEASGGSMRICSLRPLSPIRLSGQRTNLWPGWPANWESHISLAAGDCNDNSLAAATRKRRTCTYITGKPTSG